MKRVTGIGGIFFKAKDPKALAAWYRKHLGIDVQDWGGAAFKWTDDSGTPVAGTTIWSVGPADGDAYAPSKASFMINYRVADIDSEYGKFGWVMDPEGNKVELWQPPAGQ
jgi:catechol 2,3-dioxygenase-like lactoylglutathione lyase family enzyme